MYSIYNLDQPWRPARPSPSPVTSVTGLAGFRDGNEPPEFAYNGTFFDSDYVPYIGYRHERRTR